jgi:hypothetical protein
MPNHRMNTWSFIVKLSTVEVDCGPSTEDLWPTVAFYPVPVITICLIIHARNMESPVTSLSLTRLSNNSNDFTSPIFLKTLSSSTPYPYQELICPELIYSNLHYHNNFLTGVFASSPASSNPPSREKTSYNTDQAMSFFTLPFKSWECFWHKSSHL